MHFQHPFILIRLLTLIIPVLIHLFNFRRYQKVYFSNVQFLKEIQEQQSSRRNLKERLILAARMLALAFLVMAFARPYFPGKNNSGINNQHIVSIFLDNSYSMQTLNREGSLLDEAKRRAKEIAAGYSINDRFQLLTQDFEGRHQRILSKDEFNDAVEAVKISAQSRTLQQIFNRQQSLLDMYPGAIRSVYIISDFQTNLQGNKPVKAPANVTVSFLQIKAGSFANVAVDSIALLNAVHRPGESEKLVVRLHNYADEKAKGIPLKLVINGAQKGLGSYTLNPRSLQYDTLTFSGLQAGWQRCQLTLQDNPVVFDNQFYFAFNVEKQMKVLLINGGISNAYLKAVFAADPFFSTTQVPDGNVNYTALNTYPLIVISDVNAIATGLAQQLNAYVKKGGSLVVFPAADADLASYKAFLQPMNAAFPDKPVTENVKVAAINLQSNVFKNIFEQYPQNPDLPLVKKYYRLNSSSVTGGENLMLLPGNSPFIAAYKSGKGRVYVAAVALNEAFSNLQVHALFVPLMFRIALLSGHDMPLFYTLGKDELLEVPPVEINEKQVLKLSNGNQSIIPDSRQQEGSTLLYIADQLQEPGLYDVKKGDSLLAVLAFNDNRRESDLSYFTAKQLQKIIPGASVITVSGLAPLKSSSLTLTLGTELWKLCIILVLAALALETLLIRFFKTSEFKVPNPV